MGDSGLSIQLLGELRVVRSGAPVNLPQSKKTRALLAWLVMHEKPQRRERLAELLWDVADDPRGALRWCLSKLRPLVNEDGSERIRATRAEITFERHGAAIDLLDLKRRIEPGVRELPTEELTELAARFRGEFLEGVEFTEFLDFHAWCTRQRELARRLHVTVLNELVTRHGEPEDALPFARALVQIDALNQHAQAQLIRLLVAADRRREAEQQLESAKRLLSELGQPVGEELKIAVQAAPPAPATVSPSSTDAATLRAPLVGRDDELRGLNELLDGVASRRRAAGLLLSGEPGLGKSRLIEEFAARLASRGATVLHGKSFELEQDRPFGPWIDALGRLSRHVIGGDIGEALAPLLGGAGDEGSSREKLFGAVSELIASRAGQAPVALLFDDVQWLDGASVELLHYAVRTNRHRPLLLVFAARPGELPDNDAAVRLVRGLGREGIMTERELPPLDEQDVARLIRDAAPGASIDAIVKDSAGNPLFAIELARSAGRDGRLPETIIGAIRERTEGLPACAMDMLRWGAVCGCYFSVELLGSLADLEPAGLVESLETLERHALMQSVPDKRTPLGAYAFPHEIVRRAIYDELSEPRKRLMHLKVARTLRGQEDPGGKIAADVAHHASLGGDPALAAESCVMAGRRCLRLFANTEAAGFAKRGMKFAHDLDDPDRTRLQIELTEVQLGAAKPGDLSAKAVELEKLAEHALDLGCHEHARLGFHMAAYLRWEGGDWGDAQRQMMRAEVVSRDTGDDSRALAMGEAARCLAMLERDLSQAEALLLEARAMARRSGVESPGMLHAAAMLRLHEGREEEAATLFEKAQSLARSRGDRQSEFQIIEHRLLLELDRGNVDTARDLSGQLLEIGARFRDGSEAPCAAVLKAVVARAFGEDAHEEFEREAARLREVDAKQHLLNALLRMAELDLKEGELARALDRAGEALKLGDILQRPSDIARALLLTLRACEAAGDSGRARRTLARLKKTDPDPLAAQVRQEWEAVTSTRRAKGRAQWKA